MRDTILMCGAVMGAIAICMLANAIVERIAHALPLVQP